MSLVLNEIHGRGDGLAPFIVAAADRRISNPDGTYHSTRRKLFAVPKIAGAVSYFGLAAFSQRGRLVFLSDWLPTFIRRTPETTPGGFAQALFQELGGLMDSRALASAPSGFHICGFDDCGRPDFWFMSNIGRMNGFAYVDLHPSCSAPASHFLVRYACARGANVITRSF